MTFIYIYLSSGLTKVYQLCVCVWIWHLGGNDWLCWATHIIFCGLYKLLNTWFVCITLRLAPQCGGGSFLSSGCMGRGCGDRDMGPILVCVRAKSNMSMFTLERQNVFPLSYVFIIIVSIYLLVWIKYKYMHLNLTWQLACINNTIIAISILKVMWHLLISTALKQYESQILLSSEDST